MGIDLAAALGIQDDAAPPQTTTGADGIPTMSVSAPKKSGVDLFSALGVDATQNYSPTPVAPTEAASTLRGVAKNAAAGAVEGAQSVGNTILNPGGNLIGKPLATAAVFAHDALAPMFGGQRFPDDVRNMLLGDNVAQPVTRATDAAASAMGIPTPDEVPANGAAERYTRAGAAGAVQGGLLASPSVIAPLAGAGMGVSGQAGADAVPDWAKPMAGMAGGAVGAVGIPQGASMARSGASTVMRKLGTTYNMGRKEDIGGSRITGAQIQQTGEQLSNEIGPTGRANIARSLDDEKTAQDLESQLESANLHPLEREQIQQQLQDLQSNRAVPVPGYQPTTAELAGTAGAQDLDLAARKVSAPAFVERATENNNAMVRTLQTAGDAQDAVPSPPVAEGNPQTLGQVVTDRLRQIETAGEQAVAGAKQGVQSNPLQDAGTEHISATGAKLRETLKAAREPWIKAYREAWAKVDPEGTWAISSQPLRDRIGDLRQTISPSASINPDLMRIIDRALAIPGRAVRFSDLAQMRADANDFTRKYGASMSDNEGRIAGAIKSAIDDTIAASIDEKAKVDPDIVNRLRGIPNDGQGDAISLGAGGSAGVPAANVAVQAGDNRGGGESQTRRNSASGNSGLPAGAATNQGTAPLRPPARPPSLVDFIIGRGGIRNQGGDLNEDIQAIHHRMGGRLVNNKTGESPDYVREAATEAGYLKQGSDINDLVDALEEHTRGNPTYAQHDVAQLHEWEQGQKATKANAAFDERLYDARDKVNVWAEQNGMRLSKEAQENAAHLIAADGKMHVEDAVRSALVPEEDQALETNAKMNAFGQPGIPLAEQTAMDVNSSGGIKPNVTPENMQAYAAANAATKAKKERFDQGGVGAALQRGSGYEPFRVQDGNVPRQIFTGNNIEPREVDRFIRAVGAERAQEIGRDVLVNDMRSKHIMLPDGNLDAGKFGRWLEARRDTLERFPDLKKQLGDLKSAQDTFNEATAKAIADRKSFQASVAGRIIGADPRHIFQKIMAGDNPEANMQQLVDQIRNNPDAVASLKRIVTDSIVEKFSSAKPSTDGFDMLKADGLRKFIVQFKAPLRVLFGGQGLQNIEAVGALLRRQAGGPNAVAGSQTAAHGARTMRTGIGKDADHANTTLFALLAEHLGSALHHAGGIIAAPVGMVFAKRINAMRQAAIANRDDLASFAMLHPEVAKSLMERADAHNGISLAAQKRFSAAMRAAIMADLSSDGEQKK